MSNGANMVERSLHSGGDTTDTSVDTPSSKSKQSDAATPGGDADELRDSGPGRILVMDDEEMIRDLAKAMFGRFGFEVDVAEDGAQAVGLFEDAANSGRPYAAVILDLRIPGGLGGREVVRLLREINDSVKVAAASGDALDPVMLDYTENGFDASIAKPYNLQQIKTLLEKLALNV